MDSNGLVTVYIITHNRSSLLERALTSVIGQDYENLEIIIVDDCSSDDTRSMVLKYMADDSRLVYLRNDVNCGPCYSRNLAISKANGEYITGLDDDDYFLSHRVSDFLNHRHLLDSNAFLYSDVFWKKESGLSKAKINFLFKRQIKFYDLLLFNFVGNQIFAKSDFFKRNLFDVNMPAWQDLDCWMMMLKTENKKAYNIRKYNYIQDISHSHERISDSKVERVRLAYDILVTKHALPNVEKKILSNQLIMYGFKGGGALLAMFTSFSNFTLSTILIFLRNLSFLFLTRKR